MPGIFNISNIKGINSLSAAEIAEQIPQDTTTLTFDSVGWVSIQYIELPDSAWSQKWKPVPRSNNAIPVTMTTTWDDLLNYDSSYLSNHNNQKLSDLLNNLAKTHTISTINLQKVNIYTLPTKTILGIIELFARAGVNKLIMSEQTMSITKKPSELEKIIAFALSRRIEINYKTSMLSAHSMSAVLYYATIAAHQYLNLAFNVKLPKASIELMQQVMKNRVEFILPSDIKNRNILDIILVIKKTPTIKSVDLSHARLDKQGIDYLSQLLGSLILDGKKIILTKNTFKNDTLIANIQTKLMFKHHLQTMRKNEKLETEVKTLNKKVIALESQLKSLKTQASNNVETKIEPRNSLFNSI